MIQSIELESLDDPRYDGTRIPNQDEWHTYRIEEPIMPFRPEDHWGNGQPVVYFALI